MSLNDQQKRVDDALQVYTKPYWSPLSQLARLVEEVGELARILNHKYGEKIKKSSEEPDDLEGEIGDILFGLICIANSEGVNIDEALDKVLNKVNTRDKDRYERR